VLNTEGTSLAKVLENREIADLVTALGCGAGPSATRRSCGTSGWCCWPTPTATGTTSRRCC
jgi:hypothetical protein